jgi:Tfp pilus assembly protein PilE
MAEIMVVIVVMGVLALIAVPIYNNVRGAAFDAVKAKNATTLNQLMTTCHNAGVDMTTWATSKDAIDALTIGVNLPTSIASAATPQQIKLQEVLNPAAYTFTPGDATKAPSFTANLDGATTKP